MREIRLQQPLDGLRRILRLEVVIDFLPYIRMGTEAAAREQMVALDGVLLANRDFCGNQPDIADVVLRAGMVAAGDVNIDRRLDIDSRLAPVADLGGVQ